MSKAQQTRLKRRLLLCGLALVVSVAAAILLVVSRELMRDFNEYSMLMLGGLMVLMMIWRPQGLLPMTRPQLKLKNGAAKGEQALVSHYYL